jgi:spore coat polysaccharide biosynthesis predicted glycosyltransferase SpsG
LTDAHSVGTFRRRVTHSIENHGRAGRVLFVPVSGARGMGEYARALAFATALAHRSPQTEIHFVLSREAPYAADTPFPHTLLPSSPTFHSGKVSELIRTFRPTLVVFDNAGRTAQLRSAVRFGAKVIYVSSRPRQRRKAFRLSWMRMLDEHWIAYPEFIAGAPGLLERLKLQWLGRPSVRYLDAVLPPPDANLAVEMMAKFDTTPGHYVLVVPGGGTQHPGAENAPQIVAEAARQLAERGINTVLVGVEPAAQSTQLRVAPRMPMAQLAELIRSARLVISNGGDTLLQTIACGRPCVAVPIAGDQAYRIEKCERAGLAQGSPLVSEAIARTAMGVLENHTRQHRGGEAAREVTNGMEMAISVIQRLATPDC